MRNTMEKTIKSIWTELEGQPTDSTEIKKRKYKRLDLDRETGLRLSCTFPERFRELLIEIGSGKNTTGLSFPKWKGVRFSLLELSIPEPGTRHICLTLNKQEHGDVFTAICSDLADELKDITTADKRRMAVIDFLDRWTRFFERYTLTGLSAERQRGLFGELWWMRRLIKSGMGNEIAINSWKGYSGGFHDYEIEGMVLEVKTTVSKEPRRVRISSERQLDDRGFISLHLLVLSLIEAQAGGESLPGIIDSIRELLSENKASARKFESCLRDAGYLNTHADIYQSSYAVREEEIFNVKDGFPRLIELPAGIGDINYSVVVGACSDFIVNIDKYINELKEGIK
jgi:hypothetical protein